MADETMIPILPCHSVNDMFEFYTALGFEITYRQEKPNVYGAVQRGGIQLHFFSMRGYDPAQSYSTCLVLVPDAEALRQAFVEGLRAHYGKLPASGIPRITRLRENAEGGVGFNVIDPGGNWIRITQHTSGSEKTAAQTSRLLKAVQAAETLADSKGDFAAAAKLLDTALSKAADAPAAHRAQALIARAGVAVSMGEQALAKTLLDSVRELPIDQDERAALRDDFQRAAELESMLS